LRRFTWRLYSPPGSNVQPPSCIAYHVVRGHSIIAY
jgi:hypothetical protein